MLYLKMKIKNSILNISIIFVSIFVFFILLEVFLALFYPHKIISHPYHEQYHPVIGWVNKPYVEGKMRVSKGVFFHRRHNSNGLRSPREFSYRKPEGIKRILLVGDSFFWGYGVDDKDIVSEFLQEKVGKGIEVINGAATGYGTDQELLWLAEEGLRYEPDIVIAGIFPLNDLSEISVSISYGYPKPFFSIEENRLVLKNVPVPDTRETRRKAFDMPDTLFGKIKKFLRHNTHTYPFITKRLNSIPALREFFLKIGLAEEFTWALPGVPSYKLKPEKAYPLIEALIKEMRNISAEAGADFMLVFIPEKEDDPNNPIGYKGVNEGAYDRNTEMSRYFSDFASANKIKFLDLLPVFRKHLAKKEFLHNPESYDHHWTPLGHRVASEAIFNKLGTLPILGYN